MGSRGIVIFGIFLAMVLLISSDVAARELAKTFNTVNTYEKTNGAVANDAKYSEGRYGEYPGGPGGRYGRFPGGGYGRYPGGRYGEYPGRGGYGGEYPGRGGRGGYCRYGCCGQNYYSDGCRCCTYAGEKADAEVQAKPHN